MTEALKTRPCQRCGGTGEINANVNWESSEPFCQCPDCSGTGIEQADLFDGINIMQVDCAGDQHV